MTFCRVRQDLISWAFWTHKLKVIGVRSSRFYSQQLPSSFPGFPQYLKLLRELPYLEYNSESDDEGWISWLVKVAFRLFCFSKRDSSDSWRIISSIFAFLPVILFEYVWANDARLFVYSLVVFFSIASFWTASKTHPTSSDIFQPQKSFLVSTK